MQGLDTSCLGRTKRPEVALRWMRIETAGNRLKLLQGEYPPAILMATSPTRFRVEGMGFSTFVDFQITDGRATALTVPWAPDERWERK